MKINDELTVNIEKMSNLGLGIAKSDGFIIFVENSCPDDIVKIKLTKVTKNYAAAKILEIIRPSIHRVEPFCPLQKVCGACQMQFIDYDYQLELKRVIVQDAVKKIANLDIEIPVPVKSPVIREYRHKIQYAVSRTKVSKRLLAGYYKPQSHEIVNIKYCPIQPAIGDKIIEFIRIKSVDYKISGYDEKTHTGCLRHVVIRTSSTTYKNLVVLIVNADKISNGLKKFAQCIYDEFEEVSGVCVNFNSNKTNVIMGELTECIIGNDFIEEQILEKTFLIGADTFFQVNPKSAENIFKYVKEFIKANYQDAVVLDAYSGVSSFGACISDICQKVVCVEENKSSTDFAKKIIEANKIDNIEINNMDAAKFFENEKRKFDVVILDPPRKGCSFKSLDEAYKFCKGSIIYVSCNPATLARDLKYLCGKGSHVISIQPFDMFCHSFHIENVAIIDV